VAGAAYSARFAPEWAPSKHPRHRRGHGIPVIRFIGGRGPGLIITLCAVDAAHRRQLIHRDLKPENIFIARPPGAGTGVETVKVLDFGIAKYLPPPEQGETTQTLFETTAGVLVGTAAYMSPEQWLGESPAVHWDLWALAVVAYESLTGALPFAAAVAADRRRAVLEGRFTPVSAHLNAAPPRYQAFLDRCFATDRTRRPPSALGFLDELKRALAAGSPERGETGESRA